MNTKALRQKILDLAIHGKLVPQDPNDEPASVLLERIKAEKERLIKEGKIKRTKRSKAACDKPHYPFELPKGWCWCKLENIAYVASGSTPKKSSFVSEGIPYIKMYNLRNQKIDFDYKPQYIKEEVHNGKLQRSRTEIGDLIMNIVGPPLGKLALIPKSLPQANFNQAAVLIRPYLHKDIINIYLKAYLEEMSEINSISTKGSAGQINISLTQSQNMRIPLPPLQEQIRIINELRVWLTSVQQIEDGRETLNLVMRQTKSKILDLAIHGKLVPQDPTDEPASELLKRINPKAEITCDTPQYKNLPNGWCRCTLKDIGIFESGYAFSSDEYKQNGVPLVRISNITNNGNIDLSSCVYIQNYNNSKFIIHKGDLLIAMSGATTGKMGVYKYKTDALLNQRVGNLKCTEAWLQQYRNYFILAKSNYILNIAYGGAQPNISAKAILSIKIDLPPINEQYRIVAKIEELFAQLDNITSSL